MKRTQHQRTLAALATLLGLLAAPALAQAPQGKPLKAVCMKVDDVNDGDTFRCIRAAGKPFRVRLAAVDAPEMEVQRASLPARERLRQVAVDGTRVVCSGDSSYGRRVCRVFTPQEQDVGALLLETGSAWYYTQFASEVPFKYRVLYGKLQQAAREQRAGLWADDEPMQPWACRQAKEAGGSCR